MPEDHLSPPPPPPDTGAPQSVQPYGSPQPRPRRSTWFWVAIIGGCCFVLLIPVVLILMALAVPQLLKVKKTANQTSALQTMRSIGMAEISYNSAYPDNGFACSLQALGGDPKSDVPSAQTAQLLEPTLASTGQKNGYRFTISNCAMVTIKDHNTYTSYKLTAVPVDVGKTGDRGYCADEDNIIKVDPAGGANCTELIE